MEIRNVLWIEDRLGDLVTATSDWYAEGPGSIPGLSLSS